MAVGTTGLHQGTYTLAGGEHLTADQKLPSHTQVERVECVCAWGVDVARHARINANHELAKGLLAQHQHAELRGQAT